MTKVKLDREPLDELDKEVAARELRETPEIKEEAIKELRQLLHADESLHYDDSDEFLQMILRPVKFYPESAYKLLHRIADFRAKYAKVLKDVSPMHDKDLFYGNGSEVLNVLIDRDQYKRRMLIMCLGKPWKPALFDTDKLFRVLYLIHFGALMEPKTQVHGAIIIMDFTGLSYSQALAFSPSFSARLLTFIQDAVPVRIKAIHILFQPMVFNIIWALFSKLIRDKLRKRIFFHNNDLHSLHKHISPECLPEKYGGTRGAIDYGGADWFPVLAKFEETIKVWHSYGYKEKEK